MRNTHIPFIDGFVRVRFPQRILEARRVATIVSRDECRLLRYVGGFPLGSRSSGATEFVAQYDGHTSGPPPPVDG